MGSEVRLELQRDDDGVVESAVATWGERRPLLELGIMQLVIVVGMAGLLTLLLMPPLGVLMLGGAAAAFWMGVRTADKPRALTFMSDGRMVAQHGMVHYASRVQLRARQGDIVSFEARPMSREKDALSEVVIVTEQGDMVHLSSNMHEEVAFKVAVTLTRALQAMRGASNASSIAVPAE